MKTVLLVGAGGSLGQAMSLRSSRSREHPPVDATFFAKAAELARAKASIALSIRTLRTAIDNSPFEVDPWGRVPPSMEQFFADVYYEVASGRSPEALSVYIRLIQLYSSVLRETTDWIGLNARMGDVGHLLRLELQRCESDLLTIITFNQDLILENLISRLPRLGTKWCLEELYGVGFKPLSYRTLPRDQRFPHHSNACSHGLPISLLKLHGSLNWSIRTRSRTPSMATLFPEGRARDREIWLTDRRKVQNPATKMTTSSAGRSSWYLWPLVVPPIYDKQRITGMSHLAGLWSVARQRVEEADRLILLGYSLPDGDVLARQLLRRAVSGNSALDCVDCINPDATLTAKLRSVLGVSVVRSYADVGSYLAHSRA